MPANLDTAYNQPIYGNVVKISMFAVNILRQEIDIIYSIGNNDQTLGFIPDVEDELLTLSGLDFMQAIADADTNANAMPAGSVSVYGALKQVLYERVLSKLNATATIV